MSQREVGAASKRDDMTIDSEKGLGQARGGGGGGTRPRRRRPPRRRRRATTSDDDIDDDDDDSGRGRDARRRDDDDGDEERKKQKKRRPRGPRLDERDAAEGAGAEDREALEVGELEVHARRQRHAARRELDAVGQVAVRHALELGAPRVGRAVHDLGEPAQRRGEVGAPHREADHLSPRGGREGAREDMRLCVRARMMRDRPLA